MKCELRLDWIELTWLFPLQNRAGLKMRPCFGDTETVVSKSAAIAADLCEIQRHRDTALHLWSFGLYPNSLKQTLNWSTVAVSIDNPITVSCSLCFVVISNVSKMW